MPSVERPKATRKVFSMTNTEATLSGSIIQYTCVLFGHNVWVLFDSRATHSFISIKCVGRLGLMVYDLGVS